ncbi:unnamed protein product [Acidithrix sp. C25]|nr:unnamed protein product [Acidithrix sp. C25]
MQATYVKGKRREQGYKKEHRRQVVQKGRFTPKITIPSQIPLSFSEMRLQLWGILASAG